MQATGKKSGSGPKAPKLTPYDPDQSRRFIEAARKAEADETKEAADRAFKRIIKPKPKGR
jgi:hypothetical protein